MAATTGSPPSKAELKFCDLPIEVQKSVIQQIPRKHLFKVQKLSPHFFSLATAELYSNLHFRFTNSGAKDDDTPAARLSDALHTFAISERNYGQYVKSFRLSISQEESFNALTLARLFWPTGSDSTKMLNTGMLLMLRKAEMLETFHWDVPVELTSPVYQVLHKGSSLRNLRIRSAGTAIKLAIQPSYSPPGGFAAQGGAPVPQGGQAVLAAIPAPTPNLQRLSKKPKGRSEEESFSGFTKLASVAFTDLTSLDCIADIAGCIKASSSTLRSFSLSLSWDLANKSRESPTTATPANEIDDGDFSDDTEDMLNADLPTTQTAAEPVSAADVRKDRLAQDAILARIFDLQGVAAEGKKLETNLSVSSGIPTTISRNDNGIKDSDFSVMAELVKSLTAAMVAKGSERRIEMERTLVLICNAAKEFGWLDEFAAKLLPNASSNKSSSSTSTESGVWGFPLSQSDASEAFKTAMQSLPSSAGAASSDLAQFQETILQEAGVQPSLSTAEQSVPNEAKDVDDNDPMDLDMDHPDESTVDLGPDQEMADKPETESSPRKRAKFEESPEAGGPENFGDTRPSTSKEPEPKKNEHHPDGEITEAKESPDDTMRKYIRATHGLQLQEFALHLVPLKASIVARALDLSTLKRITLLDVGSQVAFWQLLQRLGKSVPKLGFHMIHTDDVSTAFLNFLSTFHGLEELYLHKKKKKSKEPEKETLAPKVDIKSICKLGLRQHFDTLTHLMIKNDVDDSWDLDQWVVRTFSLRGRRLVELAISMKLQTMHTLIQNITSFKSLRTLYFLHLRVAGSASSLVVEADLVSFLVDSLIHFPKRKLKYIGISERYATVESSGESARRIKGVEEKWANLEEKKKSAKGKGKDFTYNLNALYGKGLDDFVSVVGGDSWNDGWYEHTKLAAKECIIRWHTKFWEVEDCKVFQKCIRTGKLTWGT